MEVKKVKGKDLKSFGLFLKGTGLMTQVNTTQVIMRRKMGANEGQVQGQTTT